MPQESLNQQLVKAGGDIVKLCEFFAARNEWDLADEADQPARDLLAAATKLDEHIVGLLRATGTEPSGPGQPAAKTVGAGSHDGARLVRFTKFLRDLDTWLVAQRGPSSESGGIAALREMEANLSTIISIVANLTPPPDQPTLEQPVIEEVVPAQAPPTDDAKLEHNPTSEDGRPLHLILNDTDEKPLVHEFQGRNELTTACEELVDGFLAAWNLEYSHYNRKKLLENTLRWITSAPEGQVLVLKMTTIEEPHAPYPSYIAKNLLSDEHKEGDQKLTWF